MLCESIRPVIRAFLDDLLDEKDYQDIHDHLGGCERCHAYASSVGTLSYRLYELGQVSVPPDMFSTVLYELKKQSHVVPPAAPAVSLHQEKGPKDMAAVVTRLFWVAVFLILAATTVTVATILSLRQTRKEGGVSVAPYAPAPAVTGQRPETTLMHWHYHVSRSGQSDLQQMIQDLHLTAVEESSDDFIFYVTKEGLKEFTGRMAAVRGVVKEYGEMDPSKVDTEEIRVSIYLE